MNTLVIDSKGVGYSMTGNMGISGYWTMPKGYLTIAGWFQVLCKGKIQFSQC
jgi:hypothetical protein